ncbi:MAG: magnesium-transporting ATPase, partial [Clostridiales bacterium]|nr:magnesium-transporting ATPase [Clostridiales bacterium]
MQYHSLTVPQTLSNLGVNPKKGLTKSALVATQKKYGKNELSSAKPKGLIQRIFISLKEPMMLILLFSFVVAFGISLGKFLKTGEKDFAESLGILFAIVLSVGITLIMEGSSERSFNALKRLYGKINVKVLRDGEIIVVSQDYIAVGDIVFIESGDKILADGRLIESNALCVDESALTGESYPVRKNANAVLSKDTPLAERVNSVYSGTFVSEGSGKMIVTAIGDGTEIGCIAGELKTENEIQSPLQYKL